MSVVGASQGASEGPRRTALTPWGLLVLTDLIAVATLARCFDGPGELAIAIPTCAAVHLLAGGGRRLAVAVSRRREAGAGRAASAIVIGLAGWVLAILVGFLLPLAALESRTFVGVLPLGHTWHVAGGQLSVAWSIFSNKIAPVVEAPGLVLATAWSSGAVALAAEVLYADAGLPAILALVPAFDVIVFTGTLGTSTGRALELAAVAATALGFLVAAQADRRSARTVVVARTAVVRTRPAETPGPSHSHPAAPRPAPQRRSRRLAVPGVTLAAAVAAGVVGPALPGATSAPLIAWHGLTAGHAGRGGQSNNGGSAPNKTMVNSLVQVAEQEVENSGALLFTVHSALRLRETLLTLDRFNGNAWSRVATSPGTATAVPQFTAALSDIERDPPAPFDLPNGSQQIEQTIDISSLGGQWLPTPGVTSGVDGVSDVSVLGSNGPTTSEIPLSANFLYGIRATIPPTSADLLATANPEGFSSGASPVDLQLPNPVPRQITTLAHSLVAGVTDPYRMALRIQNYFLTGRFVYNLPSFTPSGAIANTSQTYKALDAFLFTTRTGYCQQFATAFAVLARIDGLPTRIAVGFLPGKEIGPSEYLVTGADVHAWPEVYLPPYGWVTFEPTPGSSVPTSNGEATTTVPTHPGGGGGVTTTTAHGIAHNFGKIRGGINGGPSTPAKHPGGHHAAAGGHSGSSGAADLLFALLVLALAWLVGVPAWRFVRRRREYRDARRATLEAWREATWLLAAAGAHRRRAETHLEFVDRVRRLGILSREGNSALEQLARRLDRALYAPPSAEPSGGAEVSASRADSLAIRRSARRRIAWWQQLTLLLDPRDLIGSS